MTKEVKKIRRARARANITLSLDPHVINKARETIEKDIEAHRLFAGYSLSQLVETLLAQYIDHHALSAKNVERQNENK